MAGISSKALNGVAENKRKFQGQEFATSNFSDGSGLDIYEFKYRIHEPQIGRFWQIDPLAEKYLYNSTYSFSENKVTSHRELEGLEAEQIFGQLWNEVFGELRSFANRIDQAFTFSHTTTVTAEASTKQLPSGTITSSAGVTTKTEKGLNLYNKINFLILYNTNDGDNQSWFQTNRTVSTFTETSTEVSFKGARSVYKTKVESNGTVTTDGKVYYDKKAAELGLGVSTDGKKEHGISAEVNVGTTNSKVKLAASASKKGVLLEGGTETKKGKVTVTESWGIKYNPFR